MIIEQDVPHFGQFVLLEISYVLVCYSVWELECVHL